MYRTKYDANYPAIVRVFRTFGLGVLDLGAVGRGCPDLLVSRGTFAVLVEVKTLKGRLSKAQEKFRKEWTGVPIMVVRDLSEAVTVAELVRKLADLAGERIKGWPAA